MSTITWLHIADLHFQSGKNLEEYNRQTVLDAFWRDIEKQIQVFDKLDFIVFTGDTAYHGKSAEYEAAAEIFFTPLLEKTHVSKNRLFIVPGNHDVNWGAINQTRRDAMRGLIAEDSSQTRDNVYRLLSNVIDRRYHFYPQESYWTFLRDFMEEEIPIEDDAYYYTREFECKGYNLAILGLNSAWMSGYFKDDQGKVQDQGKLLLGELQVKQAIERTENADLRIALLHHPLAWLHDFDNDNVRRLKSACSIILRGHLHRPEVVNQNLSTGNVTTAPVGAIYECRDGRNGYQFVCLNLQTGKGEIHLRRYTEEGPDGPEWVRDVTTTGGRYNGVFPLSIPPVKKSISETESVPLHFVPVVVVTMNTAEASLFFQENANRPELQGIDRQAILQRYDSQRSLWCPFGGPKDATIEKILRNFVNQREFSKGKTIFRVEFEFYTEEFFSNDPSIKTGVFKNLKQAGCLFIVDELALLNDKVRARFQGYMGGAKTLAFFVISPINPLESDFHAKFEEIASLSFPLFLNDYKDELSPHSGFYIGNQVELKRHIRDSLQELDLPTRWISYWDQAYRRQGILTRGYKDVITP